jgi:hypothetical protein
MRFSLRLALVALLSVSVLAVDGAAATPAAADPQLSVSITQTGRGGCVNASVRLVEDLGSEGWEWNGFGREVEVELKQVRKNWPDSDVDSVTLPLNLTGSAVSGVFTGKYQFCENLPLGSAVQAHASLGWGWSRATAKSAPLTLTK